MDVVPAIPAQSMDVVSVSSCSFSGCCVSEFLLIQWMLSAIPAHSVNVVSVPAHSVNVVSHSCSFMMCQPFLLIQWMLWQSVPHAVSWVPCHRIIQAV